MQLNPDIVEDTFAEAFRMWAARLIVTAIDDHWVCVAANVVCGYGTSVIGCDAEAGVERFLTADETPDGRPGVSLLFFGFKAENLRKAAPNRVGQCLMTCPTTAVYDGLPHVAASEETARIDLGKRLRFFGDGHQKSKQVVMGKREEGTEARRHGGGEERQESRRAGEQEMGEVLAATRHPTPDTRSAIARRFWRVPVMDGEFTCEESIGVVKAIGGGNLLICGVDQRLTLDMTRAAVQAIAPLSDVITPFPGGIVRSGSKVGSRYKSMFASTNDEYCPSLRGRVKTKLREGFNCVYEIVINGLSERAIGNAMKAGMIAAHERAQELKTRIVFSAGNYGGKLGKFHFKLREVMA